MTETSTKPVPVPTRQVIGLDALRFVAAAWVVLYHVGFWDLNSRFNSHDAVGMSASLPSLETLAKAGWLGVPIFFAISGFVIAYSAEKATASSFAVGRAVRLVPAMWICATATLAVSAYFHRYHYHDLAIQYTRSVVFWPYPRYIDDSTWTLWIEVSFYISIWALLLTKRFDLLQPLVVLIGCLSAVYSLLNSAFMARHPASLFLKRIDQFDPRLMELLLIKYGVYFGMGALLWLWLLKGRKLATLLPWFTIFLGGAYLHLSNESVNQEFLTGIKTSVTYLVGSYFIFLLLFATMVRWNTQIVASTPIWIQKGLRTLGLMTYPLYLVHQMAGAYLLGALLRHGVSPPAAVALVITLAIVTSWVVATHLEPPLQRWLRSGLRKLFPPPAMLSARTGTPLGG